MDQRESKEERRKRQAHELEESQKALSDSIAHTQDLLGSIRRADPSSPPRA
jgi:hypothetical protein